MEGTAVLFETGVFSVIPEDLGDKAIFGCFRRRRFPYKLTGWLIQEIQCLF